MTKYSELVAMYNANLKLLDGTTEPVEQIMRESEVVFGMWPDKTGGFGRIVIKGRQVLETIAQSGKNRHLKISVVPCIEPEMAEALKRVLGDEKEKWGF
jgi:hypothetical protein